MIWFVLIILYIGCRALISLLASSRPPGAASKPELLLSFLSHGILLAAALRLFLWLF
jgi:hypothetical protein